MGDSGKKQVPLRLSAKLYEAIAAWADDDFRSVNGQIEYLLTECVRQRKKNGKYVSDERNAEIGSQISNWPPMVFPSELIRIFHTPCEGSEKRKRITSAPDKLSTS